MFYVVTILDLLHCIKYEVDNLRLFRVGYCPFRVYNPVRPLIHVPGVT